MRVNGLHDAVKVLFVFFVNVLCLHPRKKSLASRFEREDAGNRKAWQFNGVFKCNNKPHYFPEVVFIKRYQLWFF